MWKLTSIKYGMHWWDFTFISKCMSVYDSNYRLRTCDTQTICLPEILFCLHKTRNTLGQVLLLCHGKNYKPNNTWPWGDHVWSAGTSWWSVMYQRLLFTENSGPLRKTHCLCLMYIICYLDIRRQCHMLGMDSAVTMTYVENHNIVQTIFLSARQKMEHINMIWHGLSGDWIETLQIARRGDVGVHTLFLQELWPFIRISVQWNENSQLQHLTTSQ